MKNYNIREVPPDKGRFTRATSVKTTAFILFIVCITVSFGCFAGLAYYGDDFFIFLGICFFIAALLLLAYLTAVAGRVHGSGGLHLLWSDKIPLDLFMIVELLAISGGIVVIDNFGFFRLFAIFCINAALLSTLTLILYLSIVKNIKNRTIFKNTLIYIVFHAAYVTIVKALRDAFFSGPIVTQAVIITAAYGILTALCWLFPPLSLAVIGCACYVTVRLVKYYSQITTALKNARNGNYGASVPVTGRTPLASLAEDVNGVTDGMQTAISSAVKSERMKAELITNVSHDLRTPLTSIVTYVDLLKTEGLSSENAPHYLEIVEQKTTRLQTLTDNLLEASKAASGNIAVNFEDVNLTSLVTQALGELSDSIEASKLDFKVRLHEPPLYIRADGALMWRVLENLLGNVFKYALQGTRVYVDVTPKGGGVMLSMKNISAYELNTDPSELTDRFTRGDSSRHSEGSGLGLSIVQSMVSLQNGSCEISVDGDLFKVELVFPLCIPSSSTRIVTL